MRSAALLILIAVPLCAATLRVPTQYSTIQSAFDAVQEGDTVLVAMGAYGESLTAPRHAFFLKGDVIPDTGNYPRPTIDPSPLPGSDSLSCMIIPEGSDPTFEDIRFRNGPAMYPRHNSLAYIGGIFVECDHMVARRCVFDSTYGGLVSYTSCGFELTECTFLNVAGGIYERQEPSPVFARDCHFRVDEGVEFEVSNPFIRCLKGFSGSQVINCTFSGNPYGSYCELNGSNVLLQGCVFGPAFPPPAPRQWDPSVLVTARTGIVEQNTFQELHPNNVTLTLACACDETDIVTIRHNRFTEITPIRGMNAGIDVANWGPNSGRCNARIDSNLFARNHGISDLCNGVYMSSADAQLTGNRFERLWTDTVLVPFPQASAVLATWRDCRLTANRFDSTGRAVYLRNVTDTLVARGNWWGDPSGPYHEFLNPQGRGDTVTGPVDFSGWCRDTSCTQFEAADEHFILHPSSIRLSSFPNPFNNTTTLHLEVPEAEIVRMELFDILGRRVRELWSGAVSEEKEIMFDGSALASGVYFVRVTNTNWNRPLVSMKIVLLK